METASPALRVGVYARVSTWDQDPDMQLRELRKHAEARSWTVHDEYVDHASGSRDDRAEYQRLLADVRARRVDLVLVWRFDRFARSTRQLVTALDDFDALDVGFISLKESLDTTTPSGRLQFRIIAAMAEFERDIIRERVRAGIAKAKEDGKRLGRPPLPEEKIRKIREQLAAGATVRAVAKACGASVGAVQKLRTA
ncbi:MAG: recombinase family protein [Myxococcota bacterium]|nr:recombinase family protein [Myxococcota bacterium]